MFQRPEKHVSSQYFITFTHIMDTEPAEYKIVTDNKSSLPGMN